MALCGCGEGLFSGGRGKKEAPPPIRLEPELSSPALAGTVRAFAYAEGLRRMRLRGFGVVAGLANTGGSDCPSEVRKYLEAEVRRQNSVQGFDLDPKELLDSPQYAAAEIIGEASAGMVKNDRFDVIVRALGSQTRSLEGGYLLPFELKLYQATARGVQEGRALAVASGPLYVSPFGQREDAATPSDPRVARILGGGVLREDRRVRLVLNSPSYAVAVRIRDRLNGRYGAAGPVADAVSPTTIQLTIPPEYRERVAHFIDLVLHTPVTGDAPALQRRAAELADEIVHPQASFEDIALVWEAIGQTTIPVINRLYQHELGAAAYYAARTGLRLGDDLALEVVARHAGDASSPFWEAAVRELGEARGVRRSSDCLRMLLGHENNAIRIAAYEGLARRGDRAIDTRRVGQRNFVLDVVDCDGAALVYARQSGEQRLAIFGRGLALRPPVLYEDRNQLVTVSAQVGLDHVRLIRRNPIHNRSSDPMEAPLNLAELVQRLGDDIAPQSPEKTGLGLPYAVVVDALHRLTREGTIAATMVLERPRLSDAVIRAATRERKESEL